MIARRTVVMLLSALACALAPASARAQDSTRAYSALTIRVSGVRAATSGRLSEYWTPGGGAALSIHTPFHVGAVGASALTLRYAAAGDSQPDFRAYVVGVDWRFALPAPAWIEPTVSISAGDFLNTFDGVSAKGLAKESEIFVGGTAGITVPATRRTRVALSFVAIQVLTSTPLRLSFATLGVEQAVATPAWLRAVLQ